MKSRRKAVRALVWLVVLGTLAFATTGAGLTGVYRGDTAFAATSHPGEHDSGRGTSGGGEILPPNNSPAESVWYLRATAQTVLGHDAALDASIAAVLDAMSARNAASLEAMIHSSEGDQSAYASALATMYPVVLTSDPVNTVNIFCTDGTTVYFGYSVVTWSDCGTMCRRTLPVAFRFVDGQWWLTSRAHNASTLTFIQSVQH